MIYPAELFAVMHLGFSFFTYRVFPAAWAIPLAAFAVVQTIIEHYADVFPQVAALGPPLVLVAIGLLGYHYRLVYVATVGDKTKVFVGLAGYIALLVVTKARSRQVVLVS